MVLKNLSIIQFKKERTIITCKVLRKSEQKLEPDIQWTKEYVM